MCTKYGVALNSDIGIRKQWYTYIYIYIYIYIYVYIYIYIYDEVNKSEDKIAFHLIRPKKQSKPFLNDASDAAETTSWVRSFHGCITRTAKERRRIEVRQWGFKISLSWLRRDDSPTRVKKLRAWFSAKRRNGWIKSPRRQRMSRG